MFYNEHFYDCIKNNYSGSNRLFSQKKKASLIDLLRLIQAL